jgi:hypothetical protein
MDKMAVKGNLGMQRADESEKASRKLGNKVPRNPLSYRSPDTAIDAKYGPGDKVCN